MCESLEKHLSELDQLRKEREESLKAIEIKEAYMKSKEEDAAEKRRLQQEIEGISKQMKDQ